MKTSANVLKTIMWRKTITFYSDNDGGVDRCVHDDGQGTVDKMSSNFRKVNGRNSAM